MAWKSRKSLCMWTVLAVAALCAPMTARLPAQTEVPKAEAAQTAGVTLDWVVAVVNGDVILESDVDEERRFEEIQPYRVTANSSRERTIQRLVDRTLILQQAELEPEDVVTD